MGLLMSLSVGCKSCGNRERIFPTRRNRTALSKEIGVTFNKRCESCGAEHKYHVKDVEAEMHKGPKLLFGIAYLGVCTVVFYRVIVDMGSYSKDGISIVLPFLLPFIFLPGLNKLYNSIENDFNYNKYERNKWKDYDKSTKK